MVQSIKNQMKKVPVKAVVKKAKEMTLPDRRMLEFMNYVCSNNLTATVDGEIVVFDHWGKFVKAIGIFPEGVVQIKAGKASFRQHHFVNVGELFNADMNFFYRKDHTQMFLQQRESVKDQFLKIAARVARELDKV